MKKKVPKRQIFAQSGHTVCHQLAHPHYCSTGQFYKYGDIPENIFYWGSFSGNSKLNQVFNTYNYYVLKYNKLPSQITTYAILPNHQVFIRLSRLDNF
jgi:hypothetical protein